MSRIQISDQPIGLRRCFQSSGFGAKSLLHRHFGEAFPDRESLVTPLRCPAVGPMRLLVVNADASVCYAIADHFRRNGISVDCAGNMETALYRLETLPPYDVVIVDLFLSLSDPSQGRRALTVARARSTQTCLIALARSGGLDQERDAIVEGADAIVPESFTMSGLAQVVNSLIDRSWPERQQTQTHEKELT